MSKPVRAVAGIPKEFSKYLKPKQRTVVLNLDAASNYYCKHWNCLRSEVAREVKETRPNHFALSERFWGGFQAHLSALCGEYYGKSEHRAGDFVALSLYFTALESLRAEAHTNKGFVASDIEAWPRKHYERRQYEARQRFKELGAPPSGFIVLEEPTPGSPLREIQPGVFEHRRLKAYLRCHKDNFGLPKITIEITGELVFPLIEAMRADNREEAMKGEFPRRERAGRIWDDLFDWLSKHCGIKSFGGAPNESQIAARAAYLQSFKGLSWAKVADQLCSKHRHRMPGPDPKKLDEGQRCVDAFRSRVKEYWKHPCQVVVE